MQVAQLLDRAKNHTGSDAETARRLPGKTSAVRISQWRHGAVPCPLHVQVKLCQLGALSAGEAWDHMRDVASAEAKKAATAVLVLAFASSLSIGVAPRAAHGGGLDRDNVYYVNLH